jgi:hypothetical protein
MKFFLRGLGGSGGRRSIMTDRGGIGIAAKRRITKNRIKIIDLVV